MKLTEAVWVSVIKSVVSEAVKTEDPAVEDLTVKIARPELSVVAEAGEIESAAPRFDVKITVFPAIGLPFASTRVNTRVLTDDPLAVTVVGEASRVDRPALGGRGRNVTEAVWGIETPEVVSVAEKLAVPIVSEET
jgi:hypothetical protein